MIEILVAGVGSDAGGTALVCHLHPDLGIHVPVSERSSVKNRLAVPRLTAS